MQVKDFIKIFGIEKLRGREIIENDIIYNIIVADSNIKNHSLENEDWGNSKARLDKYHEKGNYRFCAIYNNDWNKGVWVFKTTKVEGVYKICCKETGAIIDYAESEIVAKQMVEDFEIEDNKNGDFTQGFYEILPT